MGLIGMPIVPVKTIKWEEKCLTTSSASLTQTQSERGGGGGGGPGEEYLRQADRNEME